MPGLRLLTVSFIMAMHSILVHTRVTCIDERGNAVDWFIAYKMPKEVPYPISGGLGYYYMDANNAEWKKGVSPLDTQQHAIAYTLQQIYQNPKSLMHVMYNDEHPDNKTTTYYGHTKGVLASDKETGFWLVHSVPHFPTSTSYTYPSSGIEYGQTFLCISMAYKYMDVVGKLYLYNNPSFYDVSLPGDFSTDNPNLAKATQKEHVENTPYYFTTQLNSLRGQSFQAFAKYKKFDKDLYEDFVAQTMKTSLYVESWQNGAHRLNSSCTVSYNVYNVKEVQVMDTIFTETKDHSKWAVSTSHALTCVGDINRMESQETRSGGTVCFDVAGVHTNFLNAVKQYEKC